MPPLGSLALQRMGLQWLQRFQELEDNASINVLGEAVVGAHRNKQHQRRRNGAHGKDTLMSKNERRVRSFMYDFLTGFLFNDMMTR